MLEELKISTVRRGRTLVPAVIMPGTLSSRALHFSFLLLVIAIFYFPQRFWPSYEVTIVTDGVPVSLKTRDDDVDSVLRTAAVKVEDADIVSIQGRLGREDGATIRIQRATPIRIQADGDTVTVRVISASVKDTLAKANLSLAAEDNLLLDGQPARPARLLPKDKPAQETPPRLAAQLSSRGDRPRPEPAAESLTLEVQRSVPLYVNDGIASYQMLTTKGTIQEAMAASGAPLRAEDRVLPGRDTEVRAGMHIYIERAKEVTIVADKRTIQVRTLAPTLAKLLEQQGITLAPADRLSVPLDTPIKEGLSAKVTRVKEDVITEQDIVPFVTEKRFTQELDLDTKATIQQGSNGIRKRQIRIMYEDGEEVRRIKEKEWMDVAVKNTIVGYGMRPVIRELSTPDGTIQYWRKMRVYATWYSPADAGKAPDNPGYGITSMGVQVRKGVVAVDPTVIPYYTRFYVPGYGSATALDTGGAIKGDIIDLGFADDEPKTWGSRWTDIYLLAPAPPPGRIKYMGPE